MRNARSRTLIAAAALVAGLLGAGGSAAGAGGAPALAPAAAPQSEVEADTCDTAASLPPRQEAGAKIRKIRERGAVVVGIDQSAYNWGYRNPLTGAIEGFDIDLAHAVAKSVLGDPAKIVLRTVSTAHRIDAVKNGEVDMVIRAMTITCERKKDVAFSVPYFRVSQRVVVPKSRHVRTVDEAMRGKRVCAALNSSSHTELKANSRGAAEIRTPDNQLDCLVLMELGEVDATLTDSSLAAAQVAQDPTVELAGESFQYTYMGVAMNQNDTDLVAWVNQVLVDWKANGWQSSYDTWLKASMGAPDPYRP
ncbi:glutamate ABC transporter substrate-binding protein [Streptomyces sp. TLI_171]|uniref:glutamate ABC transporter substrate-binding protein n=1 Tax=Streptomyces sp. TLI_171 TaxID=1938859 RepID=UPI000C1A866B|nr:glutamate ABC transporter substrate-binding protein [Streptomyces sp. TLI_171]RKE21600.1 polar amino acid transport system substrate-binding protein [Streptomyces sp. TLI_171]